MSTQAAASVQKPALQKANPAEPGPTPKRPGAALSGADPASAVGGEAQATKAAVILPKPRVAPVQQPAVKHEEAVPAHTKKNSKARGSSACAEANSEEGQPDSSSAQERLRGQPLQGIVYWYDFVEDEVSRTYFRRWLLPGYVGTLKAWRETWAALRIPWKQCGDIVIIIIASPSRGVHRPYDHQRGVIIMMMIMVTMMIMKMMIIMMMIAVMIMMVMMMTNCTWLGSARWHHY